MGERENGQDRSLVPAPRQISRRHMFRLLSGGFVRPNPQAVELLMQFAPKMGTILDNIAKIEEAPEAGIKIDPESPSLNWESYLKQMKEKFPDLEPTRGEFELIRHLDYALSKVQTVDELVEFVGPLTPEEQAMLADPHLHDDPTPEELAFMGDDFIERVQSRVRDRINRSPH